MPIEDDLLAPDAVHRKYNNTIQPLTISLKADYTLTVVYFYHCQQCRKVYVLK